MTASRTDAVLVSVVDGIGHVTLNGPKVANAFDLPAAHAFGAAVDRCAAADVQVLLLSGGGSCFCAGGDVTSFLTRDNPASHILELASALEGHLRRLSGLPKPIVAAVHGAVAGAGLAFVLTADLVVSTPTAKYTTAYSNIGLTPDCGVSYLLPRVVGLRRALDLTLNRRVLDADETLAWGLVNEVVDDPITRATDLARTLADGPVTALGQARRLLRSSYDVPRKIHAQDEARTIATAITTPEARSLVAKFIST